jgi:hypothetical protein
MYMDTGSNRVNFDVDGTAQALTVNPTYIGMKGIILSGNSAGARYDSYGNALYSFIEFARGTEAAPTIVQVNDTLGGLGFNGYDGTVFTPSSLITSTVYGTPAVGKVASQLNFLTKADGSSFLAIRFVIKDTAVNSGQDGITNLGEASFRWATVYATTGAINTSDENEKQQTRSLSDKEKAVAIKLKSNIKAFKFNDSVIKKGEKARWHFGVIAQEVQSAFESEGLIAEKYGVFCFDEWEELSEIKDDKGNTIQEYRPSGSRYGVRYDELFAFILGSI